MIEIICNKDDSDKSEENPKDNNTCIRRPKNIKQIGDVSSDKKIYIEDYAFTYINSIAYNSPSQELFGNNLFKNTPLHDGAVIMRDGIILAAACFLPKPEKEELINKALGSRHRAAIGMSENSDAIIIVVSEETGAISVAENGELTRGYSKDTLKKTLRAKLLPEKTPKEKSQDKQSKEGTKSEKLGLFNKNKKG